MKNRLRPLLLLALLTVLLCTVAACEKERPAPRSSATSLPTGASLGVQTPKANTTAVGIPPASGGPAGTLQPTRPLTPAPPTPQPLGPVAPVSQGQTASGAKYFVYKVAQGDTLANIARKFSVTPEAILAMNQIANPNVLSPSQELKIPGEAPAGYGGAGTYTVQPGDTLSSIATRYGVTIDELQKLNGLTNPNQVAVGQALRIPAASVAAAVPTVAAGATPVASGPTVVYVVKAGDTLSTIATRYGISVAALQQLNNINDVDQIVAGMSLKVPTSTAGAPATPAATKTHVVKYGETLNSIAVRYGVTVVALSAANSISNPNQIYPGQVLRIP